MPRIELVTTIAAPPEVCFDLSLDVGLHTRSTGAREEIVAGVSSGRMVLGDEVTWKAWHFRIPWRMTSQITSYERPGHFIDEQTRGPFAEWHHEHRFDGDGGRDTTVMTDRITYRNPGGPIGSLVDRLGLHHHLAGLLRTRNAFLQQEAEAEP